MGDKNIQLINEYENIDDLQLNGLSLIQKKRWIQIWNRCSTFIGFC